MSELMSGWNGKRDFRWQLLTTVSALALLATIYGASESKAADQDGDHPTVWIELGGQLEHMSGQGDSFPVGFLTANSSSPVLQSPTPLQAQNPVPFSFAEDGKISLQPAGSDWVISAAIRYGKSSNFKEIDHQTGRVFTDQEGTNDAFKTALEDFSDTQAYHRETHSITDFMAGRDVGLGMFDLDGSSVLSGGVRIAQFASRSSVDIRARPDLHVKYASYPQYDIHLALPHFHNYHATGQAARSFRGIGPSLSWTGSTPFVGNEHDGEMTFDWGANAAILFGKQKARVQHYETATYRSAFNGNYSSVYHHPIGGHDQNRSVVVPNVGGFAGASYRIENFKVSAGYRADFFFGAIDGGIDTPKSETTGFYGPFATISVGLGG